MQYWFTVTTGEVVSDEDKGPAEDLMGPYDSAEEASRAMEIARERTQAWDAEDREWENRGASDTWRQDPTGGDG